MPSRLTVILSDSEESPYKPLMKQMSLNTSRREGCSMLFLRFIYDEQHSGELVAYGDYPLSRFAGLPPRERVHLVLRSLCSPTNQVRLPPYSGGRINRSTLYCSVMWHTAEYPECPRFSGGKVVAPATKGGRFSLARKGGLLFSIGRSPVVKVLFILAPQAPTTPLGPLGPSNLRTLSAAGAVNLKNLFPL